MSKFHCPYCREDLQYQSDLSDTRGKALADRIYSFICEGKSKLKQHSPIMLILEVLSVYEDKATKEQSLRDANVFIFQIQPRYDFQTDLKRFHSEHGKKVIADIADQVKRQGPEEDKRRLQKKKWNDPNKAPFKCLVCRIKTGRPNYKLSVMEGKDASMWTYAMECKQDVEHKHPITFHVKRMVIDERRQTFDVPGGINSDLMVAVLFEKHQSWERWMSERRYDPAVLALQEL